jgi:hypothetical protein
MNSVAVKASLFKQAGLLARNVFLTRFLGQAANSFADWVEYQAIFLPIATHP